ncbi:unnamed protein product [Mycena citricolor]|uniref:Uncharacterized protein n=1 Tax=Mycena citricolor TaxID=2018698 RepID=A0AAD2K656_9AGAR|nr:unnamed protein product [Mycena citricolor]
MHWSGTASLIWLQVSTGNSGENLILPGCGASIRLRSLPLRNSHFISLSFKLLVPSHALPCQGSKIGQLATVPDMSNDRQHATQPDHPAQNERGREMRNALNVVD